MVFSVRSGSGKIVEGKLRGVGIPNSTPMVTSWWGEKRPSQRRTVSLRVMLVEILCRILLKHLHWIYHIQNPPAKLSLQCSPMVETSGSGERVKQEVYIADCG